MNLLYKITKFCDKFEEPTKRDSHDVLYHTLDLLTEEVDETYKAVENNDAEGTLDGFGDVAFVALNGIYKMFRIIGCTHEVATRRLYKVIDRIAVANLSKLQADGSVKRDINGKVVKPDSFKAPVHADLLKVDKCVGC